MQSLYNKVLKNTKIISGGTKDIVTDYEPPKNTVEKAQRETNAKEFIESYENLAKTMLENARRQGEQILSEAYKEAEIIESEAYPKAYEAGYEKGKKEGYEEAYKIAYEENIKKANLEKEQLIREAQTTSSEIISSAKEEYIKYLDEKKENLKDMIKEIIEAVLLKELQQEDGLNSMISGILDDVKSSKTVIIRCNSLYKNQLEKEISFWKEKNVFKGDIFIIKDDSLKEGNACVEKDNGKININVESILQKIDEIFNI